MAAGSVPPAVGIAIFAAFGLAAVAISLAFKTGHRRGLARYYFDAAQPAYVRNLVFAQLPLGIFCLAGALMIGAFQISHAGSVPVVVMGVVSMAVSFWGAIAWLRQPPDGLKPQWLREEEQARGWDAATPDRPAPGGAWVMAGMSVVGVAMLIVALGLAVAVVAALILGWVAR